LRKLRLLVAGLVVAAGAAAGLHDPTPADNDKMIAALLVEQLRPEFRLPAIIDANTRLVSLEAQDGKVVFGYSLLHGTAGALAAAVEQDRARIASALCPGLESIFAKGVSVELRYRIADEARYTPLLLRPTRCI
jgi:hypothetical protein